VWTRPKNWFDWGGGWKGSKEVRLTCKGNGKKGPPDGLGIGHRATFCGLWRPESYRSTRLLLIKQ
jgi:hypothetical protein